MTEVAPAPSPSPDESLACPLCEYDLRGQVEPRCPECGYRFTWDELRDPARRLHPYLFEHHPERNVWSFFRTLVGGLRPRQFWGTLLPTQPSRPGRLAVYAIIIALSFVAPAALNVARVIESQWTMMAQQRAAYAQSLARFGLRAAARINLAAPPPGPTVISPPPTTQQLLNATTPAPSFRAVLRQPYVANWIERTVIHSAVPMAWGGLTLAAMMIFQVSLRRARLRPVHLVRCVVYSGDLLLWVYVLDVITIATEHLLTHTFGVVGIWPLGNTVMTFAYCIAVVTFFFRLVTAFKRYLRFDHPISTVLATQLITLLAVWSILLNM
jgi:hypothetical protein